MSVYAGPKMKSDNLKLLLDPSNVKSLGLENLFLHSEDFTQSSWGKSIAIALSTNSDVAPDGTYSATKLTLSSGYSGDIPIFSNFSVVALGRYTQSLYLKYSGMRYAYLWWDNGSGFGCTVEIDLLTGTTRDTRIGNNAFYTSFVTSVTSIGNGWYRLGITASITSTVSNPQVRLYISNIQWVSGNFGTPSQYNQDGTSGIYIWGWQAEQANSPGTYIKTTGSVINRQAIDLSNSGNNGSISNGAFIDYSNNSSYYFDGVNDVVLVPTSNGFDTANSTVNVSLSFWCKITPNSVFDHLAGFRDEGQSWGNFYMLILDQNSVTDAMEARIAAGTSGNRQLGSNVFSRYNVWTHYAITGSSNTFKWYLNGVLQQTDSGLLSTTFGSTSPSFTIGRTAGGSFPALGNISDVRFYNTAISDSDILDIYQAGRAKYGV